MNVEQIQSNKIKMIMQFSIPAIIAMVLTSMITVVDGFFIGQYVGSDGITAVNLGLPVIYLFLAVGLMISVGGISIAGIALGENHLEKCRNVFNQTICTSVIASFALSMIIWFCFTPMFNLLKATEQVEMYFNEYYRIMLLQLPIMVINSSFGMFIRGEGNPQYFMKINIMNVVLNGVLDYLFIRWLHWGITGVAVASLMSAIVTLLLIVYYFHKKSKVYCFETFTFSRNVLKNTVFNGGSEFIGQMSLCISMFAYNYVIMKDIGEEGVTAFAVAGYISYVFSMIIIGFGQGIVPLIGFCYGAKAYNTSKELRDVTNRIVCFIGGGVFAVLLFVSKWYGNIFVADQSVVDMIESGVKIFTISFLFSGINTVTSFYFTSIGRAFESAVISAARGLIILLLCVFTFPQLFGMTGVWLAAPVTEGATLMICLYFMVQERKKDKRLIHG